MGCNKSNIHNVLHANDIRMGPSNVSSILHTLWYLLSQQKSIQGYSMEFFEYQQVTIDRSSDSVEHHRSSFLVLCQIKSTYLWCSNCNFVSKDCNVCKLYPTPYPHKLLNSSFIIDSCCNSSTNAQSERSSNIRSLISFLALPCYRSHFRVAFYNQ